MTSVELPTTIWTAIRQAPRDPAVLNQILERYRSPVLAFIRNHGFLAHDAEDVAQDVLLTLVRKDILAKADPTRGKFRSLLLAVTRHAMSSRKRYDGREKRGGGVEHEALTDHVENLVVMPEEPAFDELWVQNLVRLAMHQLWKECEEQQTPYFRALSRYANGAVPYEALAQDLGTSVTNVKNYLHQARAKMRRYVQKEVEAYAASRDEYETELVYLSKFLTAPGQ